MRALSHSHDRLYQRRRADDIRNDKQTDIPRRWSDSRRRYRDRYGEDCLPARGSDNKVQWGCTHACDYWPRKFKTKRLVKIHQTSCDCVFELTDENFEFRQIVWVFIRPHWLSLVQSQVTRIWGARVGTRQGNNRRKMTVMTRYDDTSFPGWESSDGYRYRICVGQLRRRQDLKSHEIRNSFETRSKHDR